RIIKRLAIANLAAPRRQPGCTRCEAGVNFDQNRPLRRYRVERPERNAAAEAVEEAHSREARLADLRCANEIEIADARRLLGGALMPFDDAQPSAPLAEE